MGGTRSKNSHYLQLDYNQQGKVTVTPENEDRFVMTIQDATLACQIGQNRKAFRSQFKELMDKLADWLREHRKSVHKSFLTAGSGGSLLFLVIRSRKKFDRPLTEALALLDASIARDKNLDLIRLEALALPRLSEEDATSFLLPGGVLEYNVAE